MHLELDPKLWGTLAAHHHFVGFTCTGVEENGFHCAHACDPIHWHTHQGKVKEPSLTRAGHVIWSVDVRSHQWRLGDQFRHYASVCWWSGCTQDYDAHVIRRVGLRWKIIVPGCNRSKSFLLKGCHHRAHRHHNKLPSLASVCHRWSSRRCWRVGLPTTVRVLVMFFMALSSLFLSHMGTFVDCNVNML